MGFQETHLGATLDILSPSSQKSGTRFCPPAYKNTPFLTMHPTYCQSAFTCNIFDLLHLFIILLQPHTLLTCLWTTAVPLHKCIPSTGLCKTHLYYYNTHIWLYTTIYNHASTAHLSATPLVLANTSTNSHLAIIQPFIHSFVHLSVYSFIYSRYSF